MSENLDLVRSIYADWERGDFSSAKWADPATFLRSKTLTHDLTQVAANYKRPAIAGRS